MRSFRAYLAAFFLVPLLAIPVLAHHSFTAEFDGTRQITLTGTLTRVDWINPHVYFYMDVKDETGKVTNWAIETVPTGFLHRVGINRDMFVVGQTLVIEGYRAKDGSKQLMSTKSITFPDGHKFVIYVAQNN